MVTSCLSSPPVGESLFVMCYISELTNLLLPLPPFQKVSPHLQCAAFPSSLLPLPPLHLLSPHLRCAAFPSSLLPLPPLHLVSPHLLSPPFSSCPPLPTSLLPSI